MLLSVFFPNQSTNPPVLNVRTSHEATQMSTIHVLHLSRAPALLPRLLQTSQSGSPSLQHPPIHHLPFSAPFDVGPSLPIPLPFHSCTRVCMPACPHVHVHVCVRHKHLCQPPCCMGDKVHTPGTPTPPPAGPSLPLRPYLPLALFMNPPLQPNWSTGKTLIR